MFVITAALMCFAGTASAEDAKPHPVRVGFGMDIGIPSGASLGVVVHPKMDWLSLQASVSHNALAFGGRFSAKLDPLALMVNNPIALFGDIQVGTFGRGNVPGLTDMPSVGYSYMNTYLGVRLGKPNGFHWLVEGGPSYIYAWTSGVQDVISKNAGSNLRVSDPTVSGWVMPTFITGFVVGHEIC
jgi:hypothetical protein